MSLTLLISLCIFALVLEGFFSGSEMALISADRLALHKQAEAGSRGAKIALRLVAKPENVLATTLLGTNLCLAFQATLSTLWVYRNFGPEYEIYSVAILSPVILIFGELLPKTLYQRYAEQMAPRVAPPIEAIRRLFAPFNWVLGRYTDQLSRKLQPLEEAITGKHRPTHREELRYLLTYGQKETTLKTSERKMIRRILDFSKAEAKNVLLPLIKVDMVPDTISVAETVEAFSRFGHSRLPVYHERVDNVVGVVQIFDAFSCEKGERPVTEIMQEPHYSPDSQSLELLRSTMQKRGIPMSVVVNEYGGAIGILTLEDIVEEIVGEIKDEHDTDSAMFRELQDGVFIVQGQIEIAALNEALKLSIPKGEYETLAGFLLQQFDRIPEPGDELYLGELKFTIRRATSRLIQAVQIERV